jgi:citrate synthase
LVPRDDAHRRGSGTARVDVDPDTTKSSPLQRAFLALGSRAATDLSSYGRALLVLHAEAESVLVTLADAMLEGGPAPNEFAGVARAKQERGSAKFRRASASHGRAASRPFQTDAPQARHPHAFARPDDARVEHFPAALHLRAAASWNRPAASDISRRALVLLADHELNASTFATRVAVSTGAPLAAGVLSGLATLSGPLHGRASLGVLELVSGVKRAGADVTIRDWLSQGRQIAGFGHPLYSQGDPRAAALLQHFTLPKPYADLRDAVEDVIGERPNIDFALAALTKVFDLPQEAPLVLFALGRCVGWLAHALEQVTTGHPIRPRARYVGPPIPSS